jgi:hypothetical protein
MPGEAGQSIAVRAWRPGDETAILELFGRTFHAPRTLEHWQWKFQANPFGGERISLAFDDSRLVGHYTGYVVPFWLEGRDIEAHQIGDTMTDPAIRHIGRGPTSVLGRTALHFYVNFCEERVAFNYGFNVANIQKFSLRFLRSDRVEPVAYRMRDLRERPLKPLGRLERLARGIQLRLVKNATEEWDELFRLAAPHYRFLVRRDARYVNWRYFRAPDQPYAVIEIRKWRQLVGWLVVRMQENRLRVGDALLHPEHGEVFEIAMRHLGRVYPVDTIEGWFPPRPAWLGAVIGDVLESRPEPQDLSVMCVPFRMPEAVSRMRESLYYTLGDSDLF